MATVEEVYTAIRNADAAGDGAAVKKLGAYLATLQSSPKPVAKTDAKPRGIASQIGQGVRSALGGIATLGDIGVMAASAPAYIGHALSGTPYTAPTPFGDMANRASNAMGLPMPESDSERLASSMVGGAASALPFLMTGGSTAAPTLARMGVEGVSGAASGGAGELARQAGLGPLGQLAAAFAGGIGGGVGASRVAAGVQRVVSPQTLAPTISSAEKIAATRLRESMNDPARAMARLDEYGASVVPGARPTLAEATGDPGIIGLSRSMRNTARNGANITQAMGDNTIARTSFIDDTLGAGSTDELNAIAADALERRSAGVGAAVGRVGDAVPPEVAGMQARDKLAAASDATKARASTLYKELPEVEGPLQVGPVDPFGASLPERVANPERAAFQRAATDGLKAGDSSNKATGGLASWIISRGGIKPTRFNGELGIRENATGVGDLKSAGISSKARVGLFNNSGNSADDLARMAQDEGFFPASQDVTADDLVQALDTELRGGKPVYRQDDTRGLDRAQANEASDYWGRMFQRADMSPDKMTDSDWDMLYRDAQDLPPHVMNEADAMASGGDGPGRPISPAQSSLLDIHKRFMVGEPLGNSGVDGLVRRFVEADKMDAAEVEMIARQLREQAGFNYGKPQGAYATAAANSVDAFLRSVSPPYRLAALKQAQAAWREWASTFNRAGTPIATALRKDFGNFRQPDSTIGATLVPPGRKGAEYAGRLDKAIGADAETLARTELRRAIDAAGDRGVDIRKVKAKYAETVRAYPGLQADVDAAVEAAALADAFKLSPLGKMADAQANASKIVGTVLKDGDARAFKQIAAQAKSPDARAGLRRAMANYISKAGERGGGVAAADNATGMTELQHVSNTIKALDNVLSLQAGSNVLEAPQAMALKAVREELARHKASVSINPATGSNSSRDLKSLGDLATATALHEIGNSVPGVSVLSAIMKVMRAGSMRKADDLLVQAMIDPMIAKTLLSRATESKVRGALSMIAARSAVASTVPRSGIPANDIGIVGAAAAAQEGEEIQK